MGFYVYTQNGSREKLTDYQARFPERQFILLSNNHESLLLENTSAPSIFENGKQYINVYQFGRLSQFGSVAFQKIAHHTINQKIFLLYFDRLKYTLTEQLGLHGLYLLKAEQEYQLVSFWNTILDFEDWLKTTAYKESLKPFVTEQNIVYQLVSPILP